MSGIREMAGTWRPPDSTVLVEIRFDGGTPSVSAVDSEDGEVLEVTEIEFDRESISYVATTPSTNWTVRNQLRMLDNGALGCSSTVVESWERVR